MNILKLLKKTKGKLKSYSEDTRLLLARKKIIKSHRDFTRFIILSRSRTGSNMLCSYLDTHPQIHIRKEILAKRKEKPVEFFLDKFFSLQPKHIKASGFKIFYYHPLDDDSEEIWDALEQMKDLKIIHLKRSNLFELYVSLKKARLTNAWVAKKNSDEDGKIKIDPLECEKTFHKTTTWQERASERFSNHTMIEVVYEDLVEEPLKQLKNIQQFLDVPVHCLYNRTKKQQKKPVQKVVSNYEEIKEYFKNSRWHLFFE